MPHIDELLGVATVATAGLFVAIATQPVDQAEAGAAFQAPVASTSTGAAAIRLVKLPAIEVVARRSVELARIEREEKLARQCVAKDDTRPDV